jgi:hypothetical protein
MIAPAWLIAAAFVSAAGPDFVEPSELLRRPELVGREVVVDDRIRYFLESKRGQGYDELMLKRTDVPFLLSAKLKYPRSPSEPNVRVQGVLKNLDGRLVVQVSAIELLSNDLDRLDRELKKLRPDDWQGQRSWALWAERRGKELNDSKLEARGVALEGEALWLEASRSDADNLGLAARSSGRPIPESLRNALVHRGFRDRFSKASTPDDFEALARQVESMLPRSIDPKAASVEVTSSVLDAYVKDPAEAYRDASSEVRASLDRKLLADVIQRSLERQLEARPIDASKLAEIARERLPDRPGLVDRLGRQGLVEAEARVASMRQSEVEELAAKFVERGEGDRAKRLKQTWLADKRKNKLSGSDAEGRILLAGTYDKLLGDRISAAELLREALVIDPQSRTAVDAFLRMGFRKGDAGWYDPTSARSVASSPIEDGRKGQGNASASEPIESLKGLTRSQVRNRLGGKPDVVVRSASQGRTVEQWIYKNGKGTQVVRFVYEPGIAEPRSSAYYSDQK